MTKLLRACVRRYMHNTVFWVAVTLIIGIGVIVGYQARYAYYDDALVISQMIIHAIMISWVVGKECREGIFRNKVIAGHSKGSIFLAELISGVGISFALYFLCATVFVVFNLYEVPLLPASLIVKIFIDYILLNMCLAAIFVTISCLLSHQAIIAIVNIILVIVMAAGTYYIEYDLSRPQGYKRYYTTTEEWVDENGNIRYKEHKIEDSEYWVENPEYVGGTKRGIYEMIFNISPCGHISEFVVFNMDWHGYDYFMNNPTQGMTGEEAWKHEIGDNIITEETLDNFGVNLIYSCILLVLVSGIGYIGFRNKELK